MTVLRRDRPGPGCLRFQISPSACVLCRKTVECLTMPKRPKMCGCHCKALQCGSKFGMMAAHHCKADRNYKAAQNYNLFTDIQCEMVSKRLAVGYKAGFLILFERLPHS